MTLTEFLLARIAEDEQAARDAQAVSSERWIENNSLLMYLDGGDPPFAEAMAQVEHYRFNAVWMHVERHDPAHILADCEAKRRIVEECAIPAGATWEHEGLIEDVLRALASVYADHPDYRGEWKP